MQKIRVAVIGLGRIGSTYDAGTLNVLPRSHVGAILSDENMELVAVCDPNPQALDRFVSEWAGKVPTFDSVEKLLSAVACDIVVVATSTDTHFQVLKHCLEIKPRLVFCEKPMCANAKEASKIADLYRNAGIQLSVNYHRRWDLRFKKLRDALSSAGPVWHSELLYVKGLRNYGAHAVDLLIFLFGNVVSVNPLRSNHAFGADPSLSAVLQFEGGHSVNFIGMDNLDYELFDLDVITQAARFKLAYGGQSIHIQCAETGRHFPGYISLSEEQALVPESNVHGLKWAYGEFVNDLRLREISNTSTAENAVAVQRVLDAIGRTAEFGVQVLL